MSGKIEKLQLELSNLEEKLPGYKGAVVVSIEGLLMASKINATCEKNILGALGTALFAVGRRVSDESKNGELKKVYLDGESGDIVVFSAGANALLVAMFESEKNISTAFKILETTAHKIKEVV
ncbi:MAG: roadblock/LC7 domain-containing protein [Deferribacteres bacterium]|nr:roadblock/LC7 domain-containing protein [candidate division KSB1 bacterium]MCB9501014.1 roadblock/LC7 domain-containing protein [Deferribacteres bacterium]